MIISDLNYLEFVFAETSVIGGAATAYAQAKSTAQGAKNAYTIAAARTLTDSLQGRSSSGSNSQAYAEN